LDTQEGILDTELDRMDSEFVCIKVEKEDIHSEMMVTDVVLHTEIWKN
jgi:hypothetical protein